MLVEGKGACGSEGGQDQKGARRPRDLLSSAARHKQDLADTFQHQGLNPFLHNLEMLTISPTSTLFWELLKSVIFLNIYTQSSNIRSDHQGYISEYSYVTHLYLNV